MLLYLARSSVGDRSIEDEQLGSEDTPMILQPPSSLLVINKITKVNNMPITASAPTSFGFSSIILSASAA